MRRAFMAAAAIALLGMTGAAQAVTLGGEEWTLGGTNLILSATPDPVENQPLNSPCLICGANQPNQPTGFGYNNFKATGNQTDLVYFSTSEVGGSLAPDTIGAGYTGAFLTNYLTALGDLALTVSIGLDVNDTGTAQVLESFFFLNMTTNTVLASYSPGPGGTAVPSLQNGTGYPDYTLSGLSLAGINLGDELAFFARISGANDGPDSFFLLAEPAVAVPLPAGIWMFGAALTGLGALKMRSRKRKNVTTFDAAA